MEKRIKDNSAMVYGKIAPQAPELEAAVLGAVLLEQEALQDVFEIIKKPECFYSDANQRIFAAIKRLYDKASGVNFMTVAEELRKSSELELVGGNYYIMKLTQDVASSAMITDHAKIIVEKYILREVIRFSGANISDAYEDGTDPFDLLTKISHGLQDIEDIRSDSGMIHASHAAEEALDDMEERSKSDSDLIGDSYGIDALDRITKGSNSPDLTTIAADTGVGKTTFALNIAQNFALRGLGVAYFSLEMSPKQLLYKAFAAEIGRPIHYVKRGKLSESEKEKLLGFLHILKTKNLFFNERSGMDVVEFRSIVRGLVRKHNIKKVFVDYLQLMNGSSVRRFNNIEAELSFIARELKQCCLELDINIFQLSQVTIEKGACRLHVERDLRGSTAIGQHSDNIYFILRPKRQNMLNLQIGGSGVEWNDRDALIQVAKAREGETGIVEVDFDAICQQFLDKPSEEFSPDNLTSNKNFNKGIQTKENPF